MGESMQHPRNPLAGTDVRRLVLGAAFAIGLAFAMAPHSVSVRAADLPALVAQADAPKSSKAPAPATPPAPGTTKQPDADAAAKGGAGNGDEIGRASCRERA